MSMLDDMQINESALLEPVKEVRVVKPLQFDNHTPQTVGVRRLAAHFPHRHRVRKICGQVSCWLKPGTASSVNHHGPLETRGVRAGRDKACYDGVTD